MLSRLSSRKYCCSKNKIRRLHRTVRRLQNSSIWNCYISDYLTTGTFIYQWRAHCNFVLFLEWVKVTFYWVKSGDHVYVCQLWNCYILECGQGIRARKLLDVLYTFHYYVQRNCIIFEDVIKTNKIINILVVTILVLMNACVNGTYFCKYDA